MKLLTGNSNKVLSKNIAKYLKTKLVNSSIRKFADGEIYIEINENIRGNSIFIVQSISSPANDNLMELLLCIDALKRSSAKNITAVIPYFGYARQDRKVVPRTSISAKLVSNLITQAGADRVVTVDLHAGQIQGFFDIPVDDLTSRKVFAEDIQARVNVDEGTVFVSPDAGGAVRARKFADMFHADIAIVDKRRPQAGVAEVMALIGDVKDKHAILVDDIVDSGGTLCNAAKAIMDAGALSVRAYITHGVLSGEATKKIEKSVLEECVVTDSINTRDISRMKRVREVSTGSLFGEAIRRVTNEESVSSLFI
mgnify:CR=1 FL=1